MGSAVRRTWLRGGRGWRAGVACACALVALWLAHALTRPARAELASRRAYPHRAPSDVAHHLADFSTLPHALAPVPGSWRVEDERSNISEWRYRVEWACGAHCTGSATVSAHTDVLGTPSHAHASRHRVQVLVRTCSDDKALLFWWAACDEVEISAEVAPDGAGGAVLREEARAVCGAGGDEACAAGLRSSRTQHHAYV